MKTILTLVIALFCCGSATAQTKTEELLPSPEQIRQAYRDIQAAPHYSIGGGGFTGGRSEAEKALGVLVRAKEARLLEALTRDRNPAAQLYGLIGMRGVSAVQAVRRSSGAI